MISKLKKLEREVELLSIHKVLLTTDGSITRILEALSGEEVVVETQVQEVVKADSGIAELLEVEEGEEVNYRVVNLRDSNRVLVHAISYTPLKRLKEEFREDIMKKDMPIGKIMSSLKLEARREINNFEIQKANKKFSELFEIPLNSYLLKRNYNIIHEGKILLNITEIFPYEVFR